MRWKNSLDLLTTSQPVVSIFQAKAEQQISQYGFVHIVAKAGKVTRRSELVHNPSDGRLRAVGVHEPSLSTTVAPTHHIEDGWQNPLQREILKNDRQGGPVPRNPQLPRVSRLQDIFHNLADHFIPSCASITS